MKLTARTVCSALAIGFAMYLAARALWWVEQPSAPLLMLSAIVIYLTVVLLLVLVDSPGSTRVALAWGLLAIVAAIAVPILTVESLPASSRTTSFAAWYIGAIGTIGVICVVRRLTVAAWVSLGILAVESIYFLGLVGALSLGLVGSIVWIIVAQLLVFFWDRAVEDTERLSTIQREASTWNATQRVRQRERRTRVQYALDVAGPILTRTVLRRGELTGPERAEARTAEARLRDELRGGPLLNEEVRSTITAARGAGTIVIVFDEGGLDGVDETRREEIRSELADVMRGASARRIIIRAARDPVTAVTVVGRQVAQSLAEEDDVSLWHEIPRQRKEAGGDGTTHPPPCD